MSSHGEPTSTESNPKGSPPENTPADGDAGRVDALAQLIRNLREELNELHQELEAERDHRRNLEGELHELRDHVGELESRTDLLSLVDSGQELTRKQRCTILIQHLKRKAEAKRDRGDPAKAAVDAEGWEDVLHSPDLERTVAYKDMDRAAELVANEDVLWYADGQLRLNLEAAGESQLASFTEPTRGENL